MSLPLRRWSEAFAPSGSMAGEGVLKQLGAPKLERLELLTREALQNCWDAKDPESDEPVSVWLSCDVLEEDEMNTLVYAVFADPPEDIDVRGALERSPRTLTISDRGTTGLGGPSRANVHTSGPTDFVDFVRNVGQPPDKEFGGGSFGYGKGALYLTSLAHVVLIYTRAENANGDLETRLIAAGLGNHGREEFDGEVRKLTGRHWWGATAEDGAAAEPLVDEDADEVAELLRMDPFDRDETGTDIVIVAPDLRLGEDEDDADPAAAMELMARAIAWHFWPKLRGTDPDMEINLLLDGEEVPVPGPASNPRLAAFESAMARLDGSDSHETLLRGEEYAVECYRPAKQVGRMVLETHSLPESMPPEHPIAAPEGPGPLCHIALMRKAELVVRYIKGPELPASAVGYVGVFRCEEELDQVFRASEPPSHDDWVPEVLPKGPGRTFVNITPRRIQEHAATFVEAENPGAPGNEEVPLGAFARKLAGLIPSISGPGPTASGGARGAPSGPRLISVTSHARPVAPNIVESSVRALANVSVAAIPTVIVVDGAVERERPEGAEVPSVDAWIDPDGNEVLDQTTVAMGEAEEWTVRVSAPSDVMVKIDFEASK